jgi:polysaccharide biosynthesis/export protein
MTMFRKLTFVAAVVVTAALAASVAAQTGVELRSQDTLNITVVGQPTLTNKFVVEADGRITFPLVGRTQAAGLTVEELTADLRRRLGQDFLKDPEVRVTLERNRRVFVFGGVSAPGMYQLTDNMTLVEILARAGYSGASEAIIVRGGDQRAPVQPAEKGASVMRVNLREFEKEIEQGRLSRNVVLEDGDTIYVPRFDPNRIYVSGAVRSAGTFSVPEGTTVLQALALAGGPTERASLGRVQIMRLADGKQNMVKAKLEDIVRPGDTIIVPERYF